MKFENKETQEPRTPAMTAGLSSKAYSFKEVFAAAGTGVNSVQSKYHGITGNAAALVRFLYEVERVWRK